MDEALEERQRMLEFITVRGYNGNIFSTSVLYGLLRSCLKETGTTLWLGVTMLAIF